VEENRMKGPARVAVLGLGDFGYHFACELHQLGHEVLAVDSDQDRVQQILPSVTKAAVADVSDGPALQELGIAAFDIVAVCVGERLETAVLLVHHLHQMQTPQILVKVANQEQAEIVKLVGATEVIQPDQSTARKAALLIHHPRAVDFLELGGGQLIVAGRPPSSVIGKTVAEFAWPERSGVALLALWQPGQEGPPAPPAPDRTIGETDILILAGHIDRLRELRRLK
jgi:trk system potassium uptake protein